MRAGGLVAVKGKAFPHPPAEKISTRLGWSPPHTCESPWVPSWQSKTGPYSPSLRCLYPLPLAPAWEEGGGPRWQPTRLTCPSSLQVSGPSLFTDSQEMQVIRVTSVTALNRWAGGIWLQRRTPLCPSLLPSAGTPEQD